VAGQVRAGRRALKEKLMISRRHALRIGGALAAAATFPVWAANQKAARPLKILILGGTRFIGVHMTELALKRGHTLTFFNRGRTKAEMFPEIERIKGDRNGELDGLRGRKWDAVIDNSGYVPRHVKLSAELLAQNVGHYLFVSTISVYPNFAEPRTETSPVGKLADESVEKVDGETYGPLKALCEQAAERAMPGRTTVVRPGLIVGPEDNTDRFTYWPARAARGGEFIAPGTPGDGIQFIDARDLAAFTLDALERKSLGTYNLVSPPGTFTMGQLVDASVAAASSLAKPTSAPVPVWMDADFLASQEVQPWAEMPVWFPAKGDEAAFASTSTERAVQAGLKITPIATTVSDTLAWHLKRPEADRAKLKAGIAPDKEQKSLAAWKARGPIMDKPADKPNAM
jgi:2'-hydroxyisoflavone reductase